MGTSPDDVGRPRPGPQNNRRDELTLADRIALYAQAVAAELLDETAGRNVSAVALYEQIINLDEPLGAPDSPPGEMDPSARLSLCLRLCSWVLGTSYLAVWRPRYTASNPMYAELVTATVANPHLDPISLEVAVSLVEQEQAHNVAQFGQNDPRTLAAQRDTAWVYTAAGRVEDGLALARAVAADATQRPAPNSLDVLRSNVCLAVCLSEAGHHDTATGILEQVLAELRSHESAPLDTMLTRIALGLAHLAAGRHGAATAAYEPLAAELHRLFRRTPAPEGAQQLNIPAACLCRYIEHHVKAISGPSRRPLNEKEPGDDPEDLEREIAMLTAEFGS